LKRLRDFRFTRDNSLKRGANENPNQTGLHSSIVGDAETRWKS
jgi:hypothetical protein